MIFLRLQLLFYYLFMLKHFYLLFQKYIRQFEH